MHILLKKSTEDHVGHNLSVRVKPPLNIKMNGDAWKPFKHMWQNYSIVAKINNQTDEYQNVLFLPTIVPEPLTLYNGMHIPDPHTLKDINGFDAHFVGKTNETYERYVLIAETTVQQNLLKTALCTLVKDLQFLWLHEGPHGT